MVSRANIRGMHCPGGQTDRGPLLGSIDRASGGRVIEQRAHDKQPCRYQSAQKRASSSIRQDTWTRNSVKLMRNGSVQELQLPPTFRQYVVTVDRNQGSSTLLFTYFNGPGWPPRVSCRQPDVGRGESHRKYSVDSLNIFKRRIRENAISKRNCKISLLFYFICFFVGFFFFFFI